MSRNFSGRFEGRGKRLFRPSKPLRPQIASATNRVELQIQRINHHIDRCTERDKVLFEKLVQAYRRRDGLRVNILANELAEIRKQRNLLLNARLSLESIALRLRTVYEFGDFISTVSPTVDNLQSIKTRISGILPDVGNELGQIGTKLNDLVIKANQSTGNKFDFNVGSKDAQKIMTQAAMIAEKQIKMKLIELPAEESDQ